MYMYGTTFQRRFTRMQAIPNSTLITVWGRKPPIGFPGKTEESGVGRPKKYLMGPALVIPQDTSRVPMVERIRTTGKDPEPKFNYSTLTDLELKCTD